MAKALIIVGGALLAGAPAQPPGITQGATSVHAGMVLIPAKDSSFLYGAGNKDITPAERQTVAFTYSYWMDTTEVTEADYHALMSSEGKFLL
jgi:formylglycine-generating enzyme required for sulfatase activity